METDRYDNNAQTSIECFLSSGVLGQSRSTSSLLRRSGANGRSRIYRRCSGVIARAKGMADIAKQTGLSRETLYRTFSQKGNPSRH
ncbi:addiction module antidote protein [Salinivibrio costicola]|uniref:addiction module antidote protein n=1 Tax=Salinivibrio costicola TaxID=51367 RepID=UPI00329A3F47